MMTPTRTRSRVAALAALPLGMVALAGCGGSDVASDPAPVSSSAVATAPASRATTPALPACADIWKAGGMLPFRYTGCTIGGVVVKAHKHGCESGQTLVTYKNAFYGVLDGPVNATPGGLLRSANYRSALRHCG